MLLCLSVIAATANARDTKVSGRRSHALSAVACLIGTVEEIVMIKRLRAAIVLATLALVAAPLYAQQSEPEAEAYELPRGWVTKPTPGILGEPSILAKLAMSTDTAISGEPADGFYVETGNIISGAGWISAGPGYRSE